MSRGVFAVMHGPDKELASLGNMSLVVIDRPVPRLCPPPLFPSLLSGGLSKGKNCNKGKKCNKGKNCNDQKFLPFPSNAQYTAIFMCLVRAFLYVLLVTGALTTTPHGHLIGYSSRIYVAAVCHCVVALAPGPLGSFDILCPGSGSHFSADDYRLVTACCRWLWCSVHLWYIMSDAPGYHTQLGSFLYRKSSLADIDSAGKDGSKHLQSQRRNAVTHHCVAHMVSQGKLPGGTNVYTPYDTTSEFI